MQRVLCFVAVERGGLSAAIKEQRATGRVGVVPIPGAQAGVLNPGAIGEIGRRQQADGVLPVSGQRLLRQIVDVDRRNAFERAAVLVERRIVIIDAGQDLEGSPKIEFLTLRRGVIDQVCRWASL